MFRALGAGVGDLQHFANRRHRKIRSNELTKPGRRNALLAALRGGQPAVAPRRSEEISSGLA
jgi:hypothetical protein